MNLLVINDIWYLPLQRKVFVLHNPFQFESCYETHHLRSNTSLTSITSQLCDHQGLVGLASFTQTQPYLSYSQGTMHSKEFQNLQKSLCAPVFVESLNQASQLWYLQVHYFGQRCYFTIYVLVTLLMLHQLNHFRGKIWQN